MTSYKFHPERFFPQEIIEAVPPWESHDEATVEAFIRDTIHEIEQRTSTISSAEFDHYGSGYASYVDAWFYRRQPEFKLGKGNYFCGLMVLFSRLTNHFAVGEGHKSWADAGGGHSYLPCFEMVDQFDHEVVRSLASEIEPVLTALRWVRLSRSRLADPLPSEVRVPTILTSGPFRVFDAVFHWED